MSQYLDSMDPDARDEAEARLRWLADLLGVDHQVYPWHGPDLAGAIRKAIPAADRRNSEAMRGALSVVRGMPRRACRRGELSWEVMEVGGLSTISANRPVVRDPWSRHLLSVRRCLTDGELSALLGVCLWDSGRAGARDAAMILTAYAGGLKGREISDLRPGDFQGSCGSLSLPERSVLLSTTAAEAVSSWVVVRNAESAFLFHGVNALSNGDSLHAGSMAYMLARRSRQAGIERVSVADLRCTAMHSLLRFGLSDAVLMRVLVWPDHWRCKAELRRHEAACEASEDGPWTGGNRFHRWE